MNHKIFKGELYQLPRRLKFYDELHVAIKKIKKHSHEKYI